MALIWIIEDDPSIGPGLLRMVETEGHTARLARSVAEAGALAGDPEVVLLDLGLPDGDGLDLCARVVEERERHGHLTRGGRGHRTDRHTNAR